MKSAVLLLVLFTLLGTGLRFFNLSPFTIYPDSYQNLLVAENILSYQSVVGYLGHAGMLYPDFFMWTRPVYALLIITGTVFGLDSFTAARSVSFLLGVLAIPLAFFAFRAMAGIRFGLFAAALLALSYNHTIWSGFIMTEAAGVFFLLLFLWSFFSTVRRSTEFFNPQDLLTGFLFTLAVLTRYEYVILSLPLFYVIFKLSPKPKHYALNLVLTLCFGLTIIGFILYPWQSVLPIIFTQLTDLLLRASIISMVFIASLVVFHLLSKHYRKVIATFLPNLVITAICMFSLFVLIVPSADVSFINNFIRHDMLISIFSFIGIIYMLLHPKHHALAYFSLISIISLTLIYHRINPDMERYLTHIIPFLLIPAGFGIASFLQLPTTLNSKSKTLNSKQYQNPNVQNKIVFRILNLVHLNLFRIWNLEFRVLHSVVVLLVVLQIITSFQGLRYLNDQSWYRPSYEEQTARHVKNLITDEKALVLASFPEPYYYFTRHNTYSITDTYPFIYIPDEYNSREVYIIEDAGMRHIFPTFTNFLQNKQKKYKIKSFHLNENYHYANQSTNEEKQVEVYRVRVEELKRLIQKSQ